MQRARILLGDDHKLLLDAFTRLLEEEYEVAGVFTNGHKLVAKALEIKPDLVILDISMPILNGFDLARRLKQALPEIKIIFLTVNQDPDFVTEAFRIGASAYLLKNEAAAELFQAIDETLAGRSYLSPSLRPTGQENMTHAAATNDTNPSLTTRQREVLDLLAEGHSMKQIARLLNLSYRTVAFHKYAIMQRLGITSTASLLRYAVHN